MRTLRCAAWVLAVLVSPALAPAADEKPGDSLASLKREEGKARAELEGRRKPGAAESEREQALDRYFEAVAGLGRRALAVVEERPDAPNAVETLDWARRVGTEGNAALATAVYDVVAGRYLDSDAILPLCRTAWCDALKSPRVESCLRAGVDRSRNLKVRALCCFSLGRSYQELAAAARDLNDPARRGPREAGLERLGPAVIRRIRALDPATLTREAEACFERTIREFGDQRPLGTFFPPLGEQAAGMLFQVRHLGLGCEAPEVAGEDIDGTPMKLSDHRGKVVLVSFWASWCIPCREQVPQEKALVERMKGRPFVLLGVNGDDDREKAKAYAAREGINWRSFWPGGSKQGVPLEWGVNLWPTFFVIDARGVIRENDGQDGAALDAMIEGLVADAEKGAKP